MNNRFYFCCLLLCGCVAARGQLSAGPAKEAHVVLVEDSRATQAFEPNFNIVRSMVDRGVLRFAGKTNVAQAWRSLVSTQDVVGIKVFSAPGPNSGTRPAVVGAVIEGLIAAGWPPKKIIIWDKKLSDLRLAGFGDLARQYKVKLAGAAEAGFDENVFYEKELLGNLVWGDLEFSRKGPQVGRKSFVSKLVTRDMTRIINIAPLLNHNLAGVNGALYSLAMGSVDNTQRFESRPERLATAVPDIYNLTNLFDHVALNITDALIGQYAGEQESKLHYAVELNQIWFSKDAVALDVLALHELERERQAAKATSHPLNMELYQNASLVELGISDPKRIRVEMLKEPAR